MVTSFPYLAIAKRYSVDYGEVIRFVQFLDRLRGKPQGWEMRPHWEREAVLAWGAEQERRKEVAV